MLRDAVDATGTLALLPINVLALSVCDLFCVLTQQVPVTSGRHGLTFSVISQLLLTLLSGSKVTMGLEMEGESLG